MKGKDHGRHTAGERLLGLKASSTFQTQNIPLAGPSTAVEKGSLPPAGTEKSENVSPASPYASALEPIANETEAPAGGVTGVATSVAGTVTAAAGAAVETIKQVQSLCAPPRQ